MHKPLSTHHDGVTDFSRHDSLADTLEVVIESALKTNHELDAGSIAGIDGLDSLWQVGCDWLFAKDMLIIRRTSLDLLSVELGRRANPDGINLRVGDDIHGIISELSNIELLGS